MSSKGHLIIVTGPSGVGKTTLVESLLAGFGTELSLERVITYTSRLPRPGEVDGKHYHFISPEEFAKRARKGFFLETTGFAGKPYASPASIIDDLDAGKNLLIVPDLPGALFLKKLMPEAISIWIAPPSIEELEARLCKRGDQPDTITRRLEHAKEDIEKVAKNPTWFEYYITNDDVAKASHDLVQVALKELRNSS